MKQIQVSAAKERALEEGEEKYEALVALEGALRKAEGLRAQMEVCPNHIKIRLRCDRK